MQPQRDSNTYQGPRVTNDGYNDALRKQQAKTSGVNRSFNERKAANDNQGANVINMKTQQINNPKTNFQNSQKPANNNAQPNSIEGKAQAEINQRSMKNPDIKLTGFAGEQEYKETKDKRESFQQAKQEEKSVRKQIEAQAQEAQEELDEDEFNEVVRQSMFQKVNNERLRAIGTYFRLKVLRRTVLATSTIVTFVLVPAFFVQFYLWLISMSVLLTAGGVAVAYEFIRSTIDTILRPFAWIANKVGMPGLSNTLESFGATNIFTDVAAGMYILCLLLILTLGIIQYFAISAIYLGYRVNAFSNGKWIYAMIYTGLYATPFINFIPFLAFWVISVAWSKTANVVTGVRK